MRQKSGVRFLFLFFVLSILVSVQPLRSEQKSAEPASQPAPVAEPAVAQTPAAPSPVVVAP
ncbi:MAG: hypothetical protein HYY07_04290, partial [Elusimicrobia bacterium]|nr:hypothetical protein [Elusimicrobiota bacterium]